ncbi:hypothetical protein MLD38_033196 [Melastoma candidum]|uniref:Uncharacterized protein n=1 Tax=Melastoma candidum TaxID=119954 RepID=A0ACB9M7S7_9MYRT|nr:hypothetical protein MLD38_033196 [Melastoma candidum]
MGSSLFKFKPNKYALHRIVLVLLLSCTPDSTDLSSCHTSSNGLRSSSVPSDFPLRRLTLDGHFEFEDLSHAARDFGGRYHYLPSAILHPNSVADISATVKLVFELGPSSQLTVAARGHGHSLQGQAQAHKGLVICMESVRSQGMRVHAGKDPFVDTPGGELWINVLHETLKHGLAPRSWTDYLHLTVGGTLSNAGISGQAFLHGPQINNILELDVITGRGDILTCSDKQNSDLFYGVLGGLGQFGIITRARISLGPAAERVKHIPQKENFRRGLKRNIYMTCYTFQVMWIKMLYHEFSTFSRDQEHLMSSGETFDYMEGFVMINRTGLLDNWRSSFSPKDPVRADQFISDGKILYCLEVAKYFDRHEQDVAERGVERLLSELNYIPATLFLSEVSLVEFLDRVHISEMKLREKGLWEIPHPWLNILVPRRKIHGFAEQVFGQIVTDSNNGPILIYPVNQSRWNNETSLVTPDEDVFYIVAFLSSPIPSASTRDSVEHILARNQRIVNYCFRMITGCKQYLPHYSTQEEWRAHFGPKWEVMMRRKLLYDPLAILAPRQRIFQKRRPLRALNPKDKST